VEDSPAPLRKSVRIVQDESLIDEMRTALRGDRDRAEIRRRASSPVPVAVSSKADPDKDETRRGLLARLARLRRRS